MIYSRRLIFIVLLLVLGASPDRVRSQSVAESNQEQSFSNDQQIISGNQTISFPPSTSVRSFAVPGTSPLPNSFPIPSHFAPPVTDGNFGNLIRILQYKDTYSLEDAEAFLSLDGDVRVLTSCYIPENQRKAKTSLRIINEPKDKILFKQHFKLIGIGNYKALDENSISEYILGITIREGLKIGADLAIFQEGAALVQVAKGWSIGLFNSFSLSNSAARTEGHGNVTVGGIGYGKGETGYNSKPWLRIQFFQQISPINNNIIEKHNSGTLKEDPSEYEKTLEKAKEPSLEDKFKGTEVLKPQGDANSVIPKKIEEAELALTLTEKNPNRYKVYLHYSNQKNKTLMEKLFVFLNKYGFEVQKAQRVKYQKQDLRYFHDEDREGALFLKDCLAKFTDSRSSLKGTDVKIKNLGARYPNAEKGTIELWMN